jgi:hypothetical protein
MVDRLEIPSVTQLVSARSSYPEISQDSRLILTMSMLPRHLFQVLGIVFIGLILPGIFISSWRRPASSLKSAA